MIKTFFDLLDNEELNWLGEKCKGFTKTNDTEPDGKLWFYNSMFLNEEDKLVNFKKRVLDLVGDKYEIQYNGIFINKITTDTNTNDDYHVDSSDLSIVTYINDDFTGGYFKYKQDNNTHLIKPILNLSILMDREIPHKVLPINRGVRFSLITWFKKKKKEMV